MNIIIDSKSDKPLYIQVEEQLKELIKEPEYRNGKLLPNEIDLSKQLGISRSTIRQALNKLVYEGLLIRKKGVGTTVAPGAITIKIKNWLSFSQEMKSLGIPI
ncbi:HTH-type transcriptional repressor YvoA, partial [termite gut metagenome]